MVLVRKVSRNEWYLMSEKDKAGVSTWSLSVEWLEDGVRGRI